MSSNTTSAGTKLRGPDGIIAIYRPMFEGEGRAIWGQAIVSFFGGMCEALLLVVLAKLAFGIGGGGGDLEAGLGPLKDLHLDIKSLFAIGIALALLRAAAQFFAGHLNALLIGRLVTRLRADTFSDYALASWDVQSSMDESAVHDLLVRHVAKVSSAIMVVSGSFLVSFTLVALLASAVLVDPLTAVLVVVSGLLLFVLLRPLSAVAKRYALLQVAAGRKFANASLEAIGLSLEVRAFGVNAEVAERLSEATKAEVRPIYVSQLLQRVVTAAYQLFAIAILLIGLWAVYAVIDRPLAALGAIVVMLVRSMNMTSNLQGYYHTIVEAAPFTENLARERARFRASKPSSGALATPTSPELLFDHVSYRYAPNAALALDDVSFTMPFGEAVGVVGPSGSGKSTLIQVLLRLRAPGEGQFFVGGTPADELDDDLWFRQVAFVPQDCRTINDNVLENIRFFRPWISDEAVYEAARRAHVHDEILAMPEGYLTQLGSRGGSLSGGQRQRVAIARALAARPQLLVLDEPTSALDMRSESRVHETLTELQGSVTMLIIAHRLSTLNTCDRIMVLHEGRLQAFGERSELEAGNEFYREAISLSKLRS
ncbi:MAG: ABC transporter ATP-binding protein [Acidimicrobiales bacterium]